MDPSIELSPDQLRERLASAEPPLLIDVRKPWEHGLCSITGDVLIPLDSLPSKLDSIDRAREIVVYCHVGMRSLMAADFLQQHGFRAHSLHGGIDLWSATVDPEMARY